MTSLTQRSLEETIGLSNPNAEVIDVLTRFARLVELRLRALEDRNKTVDTTLDDLRGIAVARMNEVMLPALQALSELSSLGAMFNSSSTTSLTVGVGQKLFIIDDTDRLGFAYSGFMIAVSSGDSRNSMTGHVVSYDRNTGVFIIDVLVATGDALPHADWIIQPAAPPFLPATVIDPGSDGVGLGPVPYQIET